MLILGRRKDETIRIGEDVTIHVLAFEKGGVRIGIDAPKSTPIVRGELIDAAERLRKGRQA